MTKSKKDKLAEAHTLYAATKKGQKPHRGDKDGSIPTNPVVPCPDLPEMGAGGVQDLCYKWLKARRVFCDCHACGRKGGILYGIKHSGDIHGILPDGRHFEIECKRGKGGRLKKGQQDRMRAVQATAGEYWLVHGVPELELYWRGATKFGVSG